MNWNAFQALEQLRFHSQSPSEAVAEVTIGPGDPLEQLLPSTPASARERMERIVKALDLTQRLAQRVREQLEKEAERAATALESMPLPTTSAARPVFELTRAGLEGILEICHWLYDAPEFEPEEVLSGVDRADRQLEQAERMMNDLRQHVPLEA